MKRITFVAAALVMTAGCADLAPDPEGAYLHADVEGAQTYVHYGAASWGTGTMSQTQRKLFVSSETPESSLQFEILASSPPWPWFEAGIYTLEPRNFLGGDNEGTTAIHVLGTEKYIVESGTLTITDVSPRHPYVVTGAFELTAALWCDRAIDRDACLTLPAELGAERPRTQIRGSFRAGEPAPATWRGPAGG